MTAQGKLVIFSAPSGSGKTTIVHKVLPYLPHLVFSVSATSRSQRPGEEDGKDYYFLSVDDFKQRVAQGDFLEYEEVYTGQFYGTLKSEVNRIWANGKDVIFDVDVKGGLHIKEQFPDQSLAVFIQAPSVESLQERLEKRGTESPESLAKRVGKAEEELSYAHQFDRIIINDEIDSAVEETLNLVKDFLEK